MSLDEFCRRELDIKLDGFDPWGIFQQFNCISSKAALHQAFRHRDLHCMNCLVSRSNFKIIDVGDSAEAMICTDLARLEISLLSHLARALGLGPIDVEQILAFVETGNSTAETRREVSTISTIITKLRASFLDAFKISPGEHERAVSYYGECCQQLSYSISSPLRLSSAMEPVIAHWGKMMRGFLR